VTPIAPAGTVGATELDGLGAPVGVHAARASIRTAIAKIGTTRRIIATMVTWPGVVDTVVGRAEHAGSFLGLRHVAASAVRP
jgi:hypothetical protein